MAADGPAKELPLALVPQLVLRYEDVGEDPECRERTLPKDGVVDITGNLIKLQPDDDGRGLTLVVGDTLLSKSMGEQTTPFNVHVRAGEFIYLALPYNKFRTVQEWKEHEEDGDEPTVYRISVDVAIPTIIDPGTRQTYPLKRVREGDVLYHFEPCPQKQKCEIELSPTPGKAA